jgi:Outer membrane protein beta-barrel domain
MKTIQSCSMAAFKTIVACIVMVAASYAQEPRLVEANAQVGLVSGIGTHGSFGGGIGVALMPRVLGYGEFSYIPFGGASNSVPALGLQAGGSARAYNFNAGGQYQFSRSKDAMPYAGFGLGVLHASSSYSSSFGGMTVSGKSSSSDLYFNVGGGVRYFVNERWGFRPELMLFAGSNTYVRFGGGVFYYLGR